MPMVKSAAFAPAFRSWKSIPSARATPSARDLFPDCSTVAHFRTRLSAGPLSALSAFRPLAITKGYRTELLSRNLSPADRPTAVERLGRIQEFVTADRTGFTDGGARRLA